jgi:hypothetical protein
MLILQLRVQISNVDMRGIGSKRVDRSKPHLRPGSPALLYRPEAFSRPAPAPFASSSTLHPVGPKYTVSKAAAAAGAPLPHCPRPPRSQLGHQLVLGPGAYTRSLFS